MGIFSDNTRSIHDDYAGNDDTPVFGVDGIEPEEGVTVLDNACMIRMDRITADEQTRKTFDPKELKELADNIREHGIIQPIRVEKRQDGDGYKIVAGERRYRAALLIGLSELPCIVKDGGILVQISENMFRVDLNPVEEALAYEQAMKEHGLDGKGLASKLKCSASKITTATRILKMPDEIIEKAQQGIYPKSVLEQAFKIKDEAERRAVLLSYEEHGSFAKIKAAASKKKGDNVPARGVKKTATIDGISFTASSRSKKTNAQLAEAARQFADQLDAKSRSRAA